MQKKASLLFGLTFIILAILALAATLLVDYSATPSSPASLASWPLIIIASGLLFCIPPFLFNRNRILGGLFIPGIPLLTTGLLLFIANSTGQWSLWASWWPMEVIGLAIGFIMAAIYLRVVWLMLPASIIGITGLALLFSSLTDLWSSWVVLWTSIPFAVGLPLLLIGIGKKLGAVKLAGIILCGLAGLAFAAMSAFFSSTSLAIRMVGPLIILALGALLIVSAFVGKDKGEDPLKE